MNTKRKVITSFVTGNYDDMALYLISQTALDGLTANVSTFPYVSYLPPLTQPPSPAPPTLNLTDASADFFTKLKKARNGSVADTDAKDTARVVLEGVLSPWANYVNGIVSNGNVSKLLLSGFDLNAVKQKNGILPAPDSPKVSSPGAGQFEASVPPVKGAGGYNWLIQEVDFTTEAPVTGVPPFTLSSVRGKVFAADDDRFVRGKCYKVQCSAIGADRTAVNWSDPAFVVIS